MTATQKNIVTKGVVVSVVGFSAYYLYTVWARQLGIAASGTNVAAPTILNDLQNPKNPNSNIVNAPLNNEGKKAGGDSLYYTPLNTFNLINWSETIHDAMRPFATNAYGQILNVFKNVRTQGDAKALAVIFQSLYDIDFWVFLQSGYGSWILGNGLSDAHLQELKNFITKLPSGDGKGKSNNNTNKNQTKKGKKNKNTNTNTNTQNLINQGQNLINQGENLLG